MNLLKEQNIDEKLLKELMNLKDIEASFKVALGNMSQEELEKLKQKIASHNNNEDCGQEGGT